jgi:hypothetical protein
LQFQLVMQDFSTKVAEPSMKPLESSQAVATLTLLQTQKTSPELVSILQNFVSAKTFRININPQILDKLLQK